MASSGGAESSRWLAAAARDCQRVRTKDAGDGQPRDGDVPEDIVAIWYLNEGWRGVVGQVFVVASFVGCVRSSLGLPGERDGAATVRRAAIAHVLVHVTNT